jgi:LAS superfamily LD-carboxypeptidase LdcB
MLDAEALTGRSRAHVVDLEQPHCTLHVLTAPAWLELRASAAEAGFDLHPISSFRDFDRQLGIWNAKYRGEKILLDRAGRPLDFAALQPQDLVDTIMTWSALPGASRHHWGSDLDVIDLTALRAERARNPDFHAQMTPAEFAPGALFGPLDQWLSANLARFGFFRPYSEDRGGVMPEPWHISHAAVAGPALAAMRPEMVAAALSGADVAGAERILPRVPELFERYVRQVAAPIQP